MGQSSSIVGGYSLCTSKTPSTLSRRCCDRFRDCRDNVSLGISYVIDPSAVSRLAADGRHDRPRKLGLQVYNTNVHVEQASVIPLVHTSICDR